MLDAVDIALVARDPAQDPNAISDRARRAGSFEHLKAGSPSQRLARDRLQALDAPRARISAHERNAQRRHRGTTLTANRASCRCVQRRYAATDGHLRRLAEQLPWPPRGSQCREDVVVESVVAVFLQARNQQHLGQERILKEVPNIREVMVEPAPLTDEASQRSAGSP